MTMTRTIAIIDQARNGTTMLVGIYAILGVPMFGNHPQRCPETAQEFLEYELEQDPDGNFISEYPDRHNHHIDAVRYATNLIWKRRGQ